MNGNIQTLLRIIYVGSIPLLILTFIGRVAYNGHLGGDAVDGYIENGRYFVESLGKYTEVSESAYFQSLIVSYGTVTAWLILIPTLFISGSLLAYCKSRSLSTKRPFQHYLLVTSHGALLLCFGTLYAQFVFWYFVGGYASGSYVESGRYFVADRNVFTEVSREVFTLAHIISNGMVATWFILFPVSVICTVLHEFLKSRHRE